MTIRCNSSRLQGMVCVCIWGFGFSASPAAEPGAPIQKIVVYKGAVYCISSSGKSKHTKGQSENNPFGLAIADAVVLHTWNFDQAKETPDVEVGVTDDPNLRYTIANNHCWVGVASKPRIQFGGGGYPKDRLLHFGYDRLDFMPQTGIVKQPVPGDGFLGLRSCMAAAEPLDDVAEIGIFYSKFPARIYYDYLPMSENVLRTFVLTNVRGTTERKYSDPKTRTGLTVNQHATEEECKTPKWSLSVFENTVIPGKEKKWEWEAWKKVETITPLFQEEFQVVARADTYYFLTKSGKVYQSKKPEKGKERTMEALWTDKEQPVVTFVTDADKDRTFVFTKNKKQGEKNVYFELTDKPKPLPYNLADVKPPQEVSEPLKTALPYANILLAAGKIKVPKPKE